MACREVAAVLVLALGCARSDVQPAAAPAPPLLPGKLHVELAYATYWGAPGGSALRSAVFDAAGNLYVAGGTEVAAQWPQTAPATGPLGDFDVVVAKFDPAGRNLWSLAIGGTDEDYAYVSALDPEGNLLVGGRGGVGFPVTPGAFATKFAGGFPIGPHGATDGFLMSLSPDGALRWATYLGTSGDDVIRAIEVLPDGRIAVSGGAREAGDAPVTEGALKPKMGGVKDAFVALFASDGSALDFLTYFGPSDDTNEKEDETLRAIALDPAGNLWLGGTTQGSDLRPSAGAFQPVRGGGNSAFVAKLTPDGRAMPYFSWLGGSAEDDVETEGTADASGAFLIAGGTGSADFPTTPGAESRGAGDDGWVARIEPDGKLGMAARLGGSGFDHFFGPALGADGTTFVAGSTGSKDFPVTNGAIQPAIAGADDALLAAFDHDGGLAYATYFGGSGDDTGRFVAFDWAHARVALIGETNSLDIPLKNAVQTAPGGVYLAVAEVKSAARAPAASAPAGSAD